MARRRQGGLLLMKSDFKDHGAGGGIVKFEVCFFLN